MFPTQRQPGRSSRAGTTLLVLGIAAGLGGVLALALTEQQPPDSPPPSEPEPPGERPRWVWASELLAKMPIPRPGQKFVDATASAYQTAALGIATTVFTAVVGTAGGPIGAAMVALYKLLEKIGEWSTQALTSGGYDKLPDLAKKRIAVAGLVPGKAIPVPVGWPLPVEFLAQHLSGDADFQADPQKRADAWRLVTDADYRRYSRAYQIWFAERSRLYQIIETSDELLPPAAVINELFDAGMWPPPIEPAAPPEFTRGNMLATYNPDLDPARSQIDFEEFAGLRAAYDAAATAFAKRTAFLGEKTSEGRS